MFEHEEDPPDSEGQIFNIYIFFSHEGQKSHKKC